MGKTKGRDVAEAVWWAPDVGGLDELGVALLALLAVMIVAVVVIPLLLFGIELVLLGLLVAIGVIGRTLLGRSWIVCATPLAQGQELGWRVVGWRRSNRLIDEVTYSLSAGLDPSPAEPAELIRAA